MNAIPIVNRERMENFCMWVWWMHGWSVQRIAATVHKTPKTVSGRLDRRFSTSRADLGIEGRQMHLDEFKAARQDNGVLRDDAFKALPLSKVQLKRGPKLQSVKTPDKPPTRKELREQQRKAERDRKRNEKGRVTRRLAAFEELIDQKLLGDPITAPGFDVSTSGRRRQEAGLRFRAYKDGTRIGGLKALNYEGVSGGGNINMPPSEWRVHCTGVLGQFVELMGRRDFWLLERVVDEDGRPWENITVRVRGIDRSDQKALKEAKQLAIDIAREECLERIRRALDAVAVYEGSLLSHSGYSARWGKQLPGFRRTGREGAASISRQAAELLRAGRVR